MPLAIDLFCGLGGWTEGLLAEGWDVIGFDIERHQYGEHRYPAQLVIQDVMTLHGSQFRNVDLIVASPPCQAYSYRAMPWKRAKALPPPDNTLFEACFRIQREACEASGRKIPLIVENVRGAQKWVGRARWNFGSFYLWGDVPALMPFTNKRFHKVESPHLWLRDPARSNGKYAPNYTKILGSGSNVPGIGWTGFKSQGLNWSNRQLIGQDFTRVAGRQAGVKGIPHRTTAHWTNPAEHIKCGGDWFNAEQPSISRLTSSKSSARKMASAMIAKIPLPLSRHIASIFRNAGG